MTRRLNFYARALRMCEVCHILFAPHGWETGAPAPGHTCPDCTANQ